jgi:hypothetical protein
MAGDSCDGFVHQKVKALVDAPAARAEAGPRLYTSNAEPRFQRLPVDGGRVDAAADLIAGHPAPRPSDDLGCGFLARPARR